MRAVNPARAAQSSENVRAGRGPVGLRAICGATFESQLNQLKHKGNSMSEASISVVTGGGGDMGLACARRLLARGDRVLLVELDAERLARAAASLARDGAAPETACCDLADPAAIPALAARAAGLGRLRALVHTAGLSPTLGTGERIFAVNLVASARLLQHFLELAGPGSCALLIASQAGHFAAAGASTELRALLEDPLHSDLLQKLAALDRNLLHPGIAYGASKLGVIRLAVREAPAWGARGARVVSLSPGIIDTGMGRREYAAQPFMRTMVERTPLGRMGRAEEIAAAAEFLCSDQASFITGTDLLVDGGSTEVVKPLLSAARG